MSIPDVFAFGSRKLFWHRLRGFNSGITASETGANWQLAMMLMGCMPCMRLTSSVIRCFDCTATQSWPGFKLNMEPLEPLEPGNPNGNPQKIYHRCHLGFHVKLWGTHGYAGYAIQWIQRISAVAQLGIRFSDVDPCWSMLILFSILFWCFYDFYY